MSKLQTFKELLEKESGLLEPVNTPTSSEGLTPLQQALGFTEEEAMLSRGEDPSAGGAADFFANIAWGATESATFGVPDILAQTTEAGKTLRDAASFGYYKPWEEQTTSGKIGYIIGSGAGMLVPLTGWAKGVHVATKLPSMLNKASKAKRVSKIAGDIAETYLDNKNMAKAADKISKIGKEAQTGLIDEADELLGFYNLNLFKSPRFRKIARNNATAYDDAVKGLNESIRKYVPELGQAERHVFADDLLQVMLKNDPGDIHKVISKMPIFNKIPGRKGELAVAFGSNALTGLVYHAGNEAIQNASVGLASLSGIEMDEEGLEKDHRLWTNKSAVDFAKEVGHSALAFGIIAPAHFVKGGRRGGFAGEAATGLKNMVKSWRPVRNLTDKQAIGRVKGIESNMKVFGDTSLRDFINYKGINRTDWADHITGQQAREILVQSRRAFVKEWIPYMSKEAGKDMIFSSPRMFAGAVAMQLPAIYDNIKHGQDWMGDPKEFATHMMLGAVFSRKGRNFTKGKMGYGIDNVFATSPAPQAYTTLPKRAKAVSRGIEMLGMKAPMPLDRENIPNRIIRSAMEETGEYRYIKDVLEQYYVKEENTSVKGRKDIETAYKEALKEEGITFTAEHQRDLHNAIKLIKDFDGLGVGKGEFLRDVTKSEALELVEMLNKAPELAAFKDNIDGWISNANSKVMSLSAQRYIDPVNSFLSKIYESLGLQYEVDERTNTIVAPQVNLDKALNSLPRELRQQLRPAIDAFNNHIAWGTADGSVRLSYVEPIEGIGRKAAESIVDAHKVTIAELNRRAYGSEVAKDPLGLPDMDIINDPSMRFMYREIKSSEQRGNFLEALEPAGLETGSVSSLPDNIKGRVRQELDRLKLDREIYYELHGENPDNVASSRALYEKLREIHLLHNGSFKKGKPEPISIKDMNAGLELLFGPEITTQNKAGESVKRRVGGIFGDVISSEGSFEYLKRELNNKYIDKLNIADAEAPYSVKQGLAFLINGSIAEKSSEAHGINTLAPGGQFAKKTPEGLIMPGSKALFESLSAKLGGLESVKDIYEWYGDLEATLRSAGGKVRFSANSETIEGLINQMGNDGVVQLLRNARAHADLGKIKSIAGTKEILSKGKEGVETVAEQLKEADYGEHPETREIMGEQLRSLFHSLSRTENLVDVALREHNYPLLIALEGRDNNYSKMLMEMKEFLDLNPHVEGNALTEYRQKLTELAEKALEVSNAHVGEVNAENLTNFVRDQINKNNINLPSKEHAMEITISPQKFQTKYAIYEHEMASILDNAAKDYYRTGDVRYARNAFDKLIESANMSASNAGLEVNQSTLITDAAQMVAGRIFRKQTKKLTFNDGVFDLSDSYILPDPTRGLDGINNALRLNGDWYELNTEMVFRDAAGIKRKKPGLGDEYHVIDAEMQEGKIGINNPQNMVKFLQDGTTEVDVPHNRGLVRVVFGETSALYPIEATKTKVQEAYGPGGQMRQKLETLLQNNPAKANEIISRYTGEMTTAQLVDAINYTWTLLNMSHIAKIGNLPGPETMNAIKRRKMAHFNRGKVLNQDYYDLLVHAYERGSIHSPIFQQMRELLIDVGGSDARIDNKRQNFVSINDEAGTLTLRNIAERVYNRYKDQQGIMSEAEYTDAMSRITKDISSTDAPTFLTRRAFMIELAKMGARPEWFVTDADGNITGFKTGAVKPKGVHVNVTENGGITVFYNKTAMFYDPQIAGHLNAHGLDGVVFKSGNKFNKFSNNASEEVVDRYTAESTYQGESIGEIIRERIDAAARAGNIIELPYDTHVTMNISREHSATLGPNAGIHFPHSNGIDAWMGNSQRVRQLKELMLAAKNSEYSFASILEQLIRGDRISGDTHASKMPYEVMLQESGMVLQPHLKDITLDKLFSYFFEGGKIASQHVPNSSYNAMMPDVNTPISEMHLPVRSGGSQRILGQYVASNADLTSRFKKFGLKNVDNDIQEVGSTFVTRIEYTKRETGELTSADVVMLPEKGTVNFMIDGYHVTDKGVSDIAWRSRGDHAKENTKLNPDQLISADRRAQLRELYKEITESIEVDATYENVMDMLATKHPQIDIVNAQIRQPRNSMNDFVITRMTRANGREQGNVSSINPVDLALTQDADVDFDKSNSYMSAPKDIYKYALGTAGIEVSKDSHSWAREIMEKLNNDLAVDTGSNAELKNWLRAHNNTELARGQFVKLHNIATYFMNAFPLEAKIGTYKDGSHIYEIGIRNKNSYVKAVDDISNWVKIFIDSYKEIPMSERVPKIIDDLLLGDAEGRFEGLFSITETKAAYTGDVKNAILAPEIRDAIKYNFIAPLKRYLRYNRGVATEGEGSFTIKDARKGWTDLMYDLGEFGNDRSMWLKSEYMTEGMAKGLDISIGMTTLRKYITTESQNPFDRMMRNLYEMTNEVDGRKDPVRISEMNGIMLNAEAKLLRRREPGVESAPEFSQDLYSDRLWKRVYRDHDYAQLTLIQERIDVLKDRREFLLAEPRDVNKKKMADLDALIGLQEQALADVEIRIAGELSYMEGRNVFRVHKKRDAGSLEAFNNPLVVWSKDGKIKEVIKVGDRNKNNILPTDSVVENGRRFEIADPQKQQYLRARHYAFNDLPFIIKENGERVVLSHGDRAVVDNALEIYNDHLAVHREALKRNDITPHQYTTLAQAELHNILNGRYRSGINSDLLRKGLIWKMLAPRVSADVFTYQKGPGGEFIYDNKYTENVQSGKVVEQYLTGIASESKFMRDNIMSFQEAGNLLKEIGQRQALSYIGLAKPEIDVSLELGLQGSDWYRSRTRQDVSINLEAYKARPTNPREYTEALDMLHDFIGRGRLISVFDIARLNKIISDNSGVPLHRVLEFKGLTHKRSFGNIGKSPIKKETIDEHLHRIAKEYREGCK